MAATSSASIASPATSLDGLLAELRANPDMQRKLLQALLGGNIVTRPHQRGLVTAERFEVRASDGRLRGTCGVNDDDGGTSPEAL